MNIKRKILINVLRIMLIIIILILIFIFNGIVEIPSVNVKINQFIERSEYKDTIIINNCNIDVYTITELKDYEKDDYIRVVNNEYLLEQKGIGNKGDIILTNRNPLLGYSGAFIRDLVEPFSKNFYLGHANVVVDDGKTVIECVGNDEKNNGVRRAESRWLKDIINVSNYEDIFIGLRIKGLNEEKREIFIESLEDKIGKKYNYSFISIFNNAYYCTDLITSSARSIDIKLNYDGFFVTGNDLIISNNLFITFIFKRIEKDRFQLIYLEEV